MNILVKACLSKKMGFIMNPSPMKYSKGLPVLASENLCTKLSWKHP
jgi:hypothetical protein